MNRKLTLLFALVAMAVGVSSCSSKNDSDASDVSAFIKNGKHPIICRYEPYHNYDRLGIYTLMDADNKVLIIDYTGMALPDTIK